MKRLAHGIVAALFFIALVRTGRFSEHFTLAPSFTAEDLEAASRLKKSPPDRRLFIASYPYKFAWLEALLYPIRVTTPPALRATSQLPGADSVRDQEIAGFAASTSQTGDLIYFPGNFSPPDTGVFSLGRTVIMGSSALGLRE